MIRPHSLPAATALSLAMMLLLALTACGHNSRPQQKLAEYDFGLVDAATAPIMLHTGLERIVASEALDSRDMRYRLVYQDAARVYSFSTSRWSAVPAELLGVRLSSLARPDVAASPCTLRLRLQGFDQLFDTPQSSQGVVQLHASLLQRGTRKLLDSRLIATAVPASSADAQGGARALAQAGEQALRQAVAWAAEQAALQPSCAASRDGSAR